MRRVAILFFVLSLITVSAESRFVFDHQDSSITGLGEFYQFEAFIINTSDDTLQLTANRISLAEAPLEWSCSMCVVYCLPPFIDVYDFTLNPGDSAWFSLDVYPFETDGTGVWSITIIDSSTMDADTAQYGVTYGSTGIQSETTQPMTPQDIELLNLFPNPTNASFTLTLDQMIPGDYNLSLFDLLGHEVDRRAIHISHSTRQNVSWDANALSSGNYFVQVRGGGKVWLQQITIVK